MCGFSAFNPSVYYMKLYAGKLKNIGLLDFASTPV